MSRTYDWDEAGLVVEGEHCPTCNSSNTRYDNDFGFWKCEDCSVVWGHDKDDPDYDEPEICPECSSTDTAKIMGYRVWRCGACMFEFRPDWLIEVQEG